MSKKKQVYANEKGDIILEDINFSTPSGYLADKYNFEEVYVEHSPLKISKKTLDEHFTPLEDYQDIKFLEKDKKFVSYPNCYLHKSELFAVTIDINFDDTYMDEIVIDDYFKPDCIYYLPCATKEVKEMLNELIEHHNKLNQRASILLQSMSGFRLKEFDLTKTEVDVDKHYNNSFKEVYNHILDSLKNTSKGIVMLYGLAGTGKTSIIKNLTSKVPEKKFIFVPVGMISHLASPDFIGTLVDNKGSVIVLEDCENYIEDRNLGNQGNVVSTILNIADGILSDIVGIQIICTFNSKLTKIDSALLREGRLIASYEFNRLSVSKSDKLLEELNLPKQGKQLTLAEIYNAKKEKYIPVETKRIGF